MPFAAVRASTSSAVTTAASCTIRTEPRGRQVVELICSMLFADTCCHGGSRSADLAVLISPPKRTAKAGREHTAKSSSLVNAFFQFSVVLRRSSAGPPRPSLAFFARSERCAGS